MLDIISYEALRLKDNTTIKNIEQILFEKGIIGIRHVPHFEQKCRDYINVAREFFALEEHIKNQYAPDRDAGDTEGHEVGAEWFKDAKGEWQIDSQKASFYAFIHENIFNKWPTEVDLRGPYLELGKLIFDVGKILLNIIGLNETVGLVHEHLTGHGRMLHYQKGPAFGDRDWCGAHHDHGIFTGLAPAYYFKDGQEINEPEEAGLYVKPANGDHFQKINIPDKSILLFQVGEFGQLILNDRIKSTEHRVKRPNENIERFTFALFYVPDRDMVVRSTSVLNQDLRYTKNKTWDGGVSYRSWDNASCERYRATADEIIG